MESINTLIEPRWVIPMELRGEVLEQHAVAVRDGKVAAVLPVAEARQRYSAQQVISLPEHALIPGLINLHTHAAMALMRGLADDMPLMTWLQEHIWPAEGQAVSEGFVRDGTLVACAEMLRGGITTFNDMYFFPQAAAESIQQAGMRAMLGLVVLEFPSAYASDADDYLHKGLAARDALRDSALVATCLAPHAPYTVSDRTFAKVLTYAEQLDLNIHVHLHETDSEVTQGVAEHGVRPLQRLAGLGLLGPNVIAAHCVHLTPAEIELLAEHGCHVAHCPTSNLKLASGIAPVSAMLRHDIKVGLGSDGAASNNRLDVFAEMRMAALLAKVQSNDAAAYTAAQALEMATINAAHALGMGDAIGSITPGKCADFTAVDCSSIEMQPCYDVISHLVYVAGREHVSHVWVNGEMLVEEGILTRIDRLELLEKSSFWQNKLSKFK